MYGRGGTEASVAETGAREWIGKWTIRLNGPISICPCGWPADGWMDGCGCRDNARPQHDPRAAARRAAAGGTFRAGHVTLHYGSRLAHHRSIILFFCESGVEAALLHLLLLFIRWPGAQSTLFPGSWRGICICTRPARPPARPPITNCVALCGCILRTSTGEDTSITRTRLAAAAAAAPPDSAALHALAQQYSSQPNLAALSSQARR